MKSFCPSSESRYPVSVTVYLPSRDGEEVNDGEENEPPPVVLCFAISNTVLIKIASALFRGWRKIGMGNT